jgi:ABC-type phosphate transport system permease subunit
VSTHSLTKAALRADGLPRRRATNRLMEVLAWLAAAVAVGLLVIVVWSVARRGWSELNLDLITKERSSSSSLQRSWHCRPESSLPST